MSNAQILFFHFFSRHKVKKRIFIQSLARFWLRLSFPSELLAGTPHRTFLHSYGTPRLVSLSSYFQPYEQYLGFWRSVISLLRSMYHDWHTSPDGFPFSRNGICILSAHSINRTGCPSGSMNSKKVLSSDPVDSIPWIKSLLHRRELKFGQNIMRVNFV